MAAPKRRPGETKAEILRLLKAGHEPPAIARELEVTTAAIYQHIQELRERGELPHRQPQAWVS